MQNLLDKGVTPHLADYVFNELWKLDIDYLLEVDGSQGPLWESARGPSARHGSRCPSERAIRTLQSLVLSELKVLGLSQMSLSRAPGFDRAGVPCPGVCRILMVDSMLNSDHCYCP